MKSFKRNLKRRDEARVFAKSFGLYSAWIHRLDKKIGSRKSFDFLEKWRFFRGAIFLSSLWIYAKQRQNEFARRLGPICLYSLLPDIKDTQGRVDEKTNQTFEVIFELPRTLANRIMHCK
jgi:hypothetical protein